MNTFHPDLFIVNLLKLYNLMNSLMQYLHKLHKLFVSFVVFIFNNVGNIYLLDVRMGFGLPFVFLVLRGFATIFTILSSLFRRESFIIHMASYALYVVL